MSQEVEQMLRSKNQARAVCLLHYIELVPLILPVPHIENLCLATFTDTSNSASASSSGSASSSSGGGSNASSTEDAGEKKKKKKGNNDNEVVYDLSDSDMAFIKQSVHDFHSYGCCASLIHAILEKSANSATARDSLLEAAAGDVSKDAGSLKLQHLNFGKISDSFATSNRFLYHFLKDLPQSQAEETGKILRYPT